MFIPKLKPTLSTFKKYRKTARRISKRHKKYFLPILTDMILCYMRFGTNHEDYEIFEFYDHQDDEYRGSFLTTKKLTEVARLAKKGNVGSLFRSKVKWNDFYREFIHREWMATKGATNSEIIEFVKRYGKVIYKPAEGAQGNGIHAVRESDLDEKLLHELTTTDGILEQFIVNNEQLSSFNPGTLNTFRLVTCLTPNGEVHVVSAALRMGVGDSTVDNFCSGGLAAAIDVQTGEIVGPAQNAKCEKFDSHPVSGVVFQGTRIKDFDKVVDAVKRIAAIRQEVRYVGWDMALTADGVEAIEGNIGTPGVRLTQLDGKGRYKLITNLLRGGGIS